LAVIDSDFVEPYDRVQWEARGWKNDRFWEQPVCVGIELKYMQLGDRPNYRIASFRKDLDKLEKYRSQSRQFLGLSMLFVQSDAQYGETFCDDMKKLEGIDDIGIGIYGAVVSPSYMSWYERSTHNHSLLARRS
jgi:hypothetical protein